MLKKTLAFALSLGMCVSSYALQPMKLSNQGQVGFFIKKFGITIVNAKFGQVDSLVKFDENQLDQTQIHFDMYVPSVQPTTSSLKDMLLGEKYFNANKYPHIVFTSTKIQALGHSKYNVFGNLTIKGKTRPIIFLSTLIKDKKTNLMFLKATTQVQMKNFEMRSIADHVDIYVNGTLVDK